MRELYERATGTAGSGPRERLSAQFELEQRRQRRADRGLTAANRAAERGQNEVLRQRIERQDAESETSRRQAEREAAQVEALQQRVERLSGQVTHLAQDYRTLAEILRELWT